MATRITEPEPELEQALLDSQRDNAALRQGGGMSQHRQLWRELNSRSFYSRADLVLDVLTAALVAALFFVVIAHGLGILWR